MEQYKILAGLPVYGDLPEQFSATGMGTHSEGLVVQFLPSQRDSWVGNFQRGLGAGEGVFKHPDGALLIVVAGGQGYVIELETRKLKEAFGGAIESVFAVPERHMIVFGDRTEFQAYGCSGRLWRSRRISWDGFSSLRVNVDQINGEAWSYEDIWLPFTLDLETGQHQGGATVE